MVQQKYIKYLEQKLYLYIGLQSKSYLCRSRKIAFIAEEKSPARIFFAYRRINAPTWRIKMKDYTALKQGLEKLGVSYNEEQLVQLDKYYEMLIEKNKVMNLTAITEYEDVVYKHFLDSIAIVKVYPQIKKEKIKLIDMGTGAGFPGIPLKIMFPQLEIVLMDSLNKRINFLNEVINELGLENISAIHARAEEAARKEEHRQAYDLCVSRAVARLNSLAEFCIPFVKKGGYFISYKSGKAKEELEEAEFAVKKLGGRTEGLEEFLLDDNNEEMIRAFVIIKKCLDTPNIYPRAGGKPLKQPLKER